MKPLRHRRYWPHTIRRYTSLLSVIALLTFPMYITAYRVSVADIVPIDDYRALLISLKAGTLDGFSSPFGYRIFSPLLAVPFSKIAPPLFTRTSGKVSQEWIQATFALCTVSYIFLVLTTLWLYAYMRSLHISRNGILLGLMIFWLSPAMGNYLYPLTDAAALFFISLLYGLYEKNSPKWFLCTSFFAVSAKEITIIVAGLTCLFQLLCWAERRKRALLYIVLLLPSFMLYLTARIILHFPGNESQLYWREYPSRMLKLPQLLFNMRGILLNVYPLWPILFVIFAFVLLKDKKLDIPHTVFHWSSIGVLVALIFVGIALDVKFNIGRIAFLSFPLFASGIGWGCAKLLKTAEKSPVGT